jgi:hypothetical protein
VLEATGEIEPAAEVVAGALQDDDLDLTSMRSVLALLGRFILIVAIPFPFEYSTASSVMLASICSLGSVWFMKVEG